MSIAQPFLQLPVAGNQGEEWVIVNYLDWDSMGVSDYNCGTKSYDGHQGTDFVIRSFAAMDDSVAVYAVAAGTVTYTIDNLYDRETSGDTSKRLGNYVAISHPNSYYTYYAHLKQHSVQVEVGDIVAAGELIGYVGSSGNSTDPHLHFELWYDSLYVVDPFAGTCGNVVFAFIDPPAYDTSLNVWESGLHIKKELTINDLRERVKTIIKPYVIDSSSDSLLYFWSHIYGLRKGKELSLKWFNPKNEEWFVYSYTLDQDYWYYYYWSYIDHQNLSPGDWEVKLYYDDTEIATQTFKVRELTATSQISKVTDCSDYNSWTLQKLRNTPGLLLKIFNINGQEMTSQEDLQLATGLYFLHISEKNKFCVFKKWID